MCCRAFVRFTAVITFPDYFTCFAFYYHRAYWNFADFTRHAPGAFLLLGAELRGDRRIQHTATFDIDEEALPIGAQVIADAVRKLGAD